jgi:Cft2 family RNA processing exonuclease
VTNFSFTLAGRLSRSGGIQHLIYGSGNKLQVIPPLKKYSESQQIWHLLPMINSTGIISNVQVLESAPLQSGENNVGECVLVGRVLQVSKRLCVVLFQVELPEGKLLKITLTNPDKRMKTEQIWSVTAILVDNKLKITSALPHSPIEELEAEPVEAKKASSEDTACASKLVLANPSPPTPKAIDALEFETGVEGWELMKAILRAHSWEWEAVNPKAGLRARVAVGSSQCQVYEYKTNVVPALNPTGTQRLVVTPLGAARGIGASCFRVDIGPYEVVLDCGTRPSGSKPLPALEYLENPNLLLVTHSHQDHIGAVPVFHASFPAAKMICTPGTREIAHTMLTDCLKVQQANEDSEPLFDELELERTLFHLETEPLGQDFEPLPGLIVRFINAGHIVGAACIYLRYGDRSLLYTGDYNTASTRTTTGLQLCDLPEADILITESTYGDSSHPARKTQETALMSALAAVIKAGGNVLIPAFALGRAQEIMLAIRTSSLFKKLNVPIYVDGLVRAVTDTFRDNLDLLPDAVQNMVKKSNIEPFYDEKLKPTVIPITNPQQRPLAMAQPSVIIASSGMLNGGASVYYAKTLLERDLAAIFISGYTDEESPGRLLQNLKTGDEIELDGLQVTVRAQVRRFNLSAHADKLGLGQVISKVNPQHLVLVHGSLDALHSLARSSDLRDKHFVHIPKVGERIEHSVPPPNLNGHQLARIEAPQEFEVEVVESAQGAWLRIPETVIESDPRWQILANNGVLKARWDGAGLKLFSESEHPLAKEKALKSASESGVDCCAKCQSFDKRSNCCRCVDSALMGRVIDPSGYCLEYTPNSSQVS